MKAYINSTLRIRILIIIAVTATILPGCTWMFTDRYQVINDDFRNSTKTITRMELRPLERRTEIGNAYIVFEMDQTIRSNESKAFCVVGRSSSSFRAQEQAFLKTDETNYEIRLKNIGSEQKMSTETSVTSFTTTDSTSVTSGASSSTDTRLWIDDKFTFDITESMRDGILASKNGLLRFYFGPIPATYRISGKDLQLLKKALAGQRL